MAREKKTVKIYDVVQQANAKLRNPGGTPEERQAIIFFVSNMLMEANAYKGFHYISDQDYVAYENGFVDFPGIREVDEKAYRSGGDDYYRARFANTDSTRIQYIL